MGLLDDAIREHLDLKRRRGGDPAEIARAEHDALGPVRREPEPGPEPEAATELHAGPEPELEAAEEHHDAHEEHAHDAPVAEAAPERHPDPEEPEPHPAPAPDPRDSDIVHQPTTEFHLEDHHEDEPAPHEAPAHEAPPHNPDDDVLEETPDFLQETPEHDRLWFEQRPPRDFDFDG